jgi:hypothetical protein
MARRSEVGKGNTGCFVGVVILGIAVVLVMKIMPQRIAVAEVEDFAKTIAEKASLRPYTDDARIVDEIVIKAQKEHLPLTKENVKVWRNQAEVFVEIKYTVTFDLIVTDYKWNVENKINRVLF